LRRQRTALVGAFLLGLAFAPTVAQAAPGDRDAGFGTAGVVESDLGSEDIANDVTTDASGRVIVAGRSERYELGESEAVVVRYTPSGALDPTFGGGDGISQFHFEPGSVDFLSSVAVDGQGRIVVAGSPGLYCGSSCVPALARLTPTGQLDPTFGGGDGIVLPGGQGTGISLALDASGRTLLGTGSAVYRFTESGTPDPTFDGDGVASAVGTYAGMAIDGAGRIVVAEFNGIERLLENGSPDSSFGSGGHVSPGIIGDGLTHYPIALAVDAANRPVVTGVAFDSNTNGSYIMRLTPGGSLDPAFSSDGVITDENYANFQDVLVDSAGRYLVTGSAPDLEPTESVLIRLLSDGTFDPAFGGGSGFVGVPFIAEDVATDSTQRIVVSGTGGGDIDFAVARYLGDITPPGGGGNESGNPLGGSNPPQGAPPSQPANPKPKALKCRKGFRKKRVHGKPRCVKVRPHRHRSPGGRTSRSSQDDLGR
jgi:uncharacterized delta-60 repeat protein